MPPLAGRDSDVPMVLASRASVPPTVTPVARPGTTHVASSPRRTCTCSGWKRVVRRWSSDARSGDSPPNGRAAGIGPKSEESPSRVASASCSAVASL